MSPEILEFEEPIAALLKEIEALEQLPTTEPRNRQIEILRRKLEATRAELYASLTPWQRVSERRLGSRLVCLDSALFPHV